MAAVGRYDSISVMWVQPFTAAEHVVQALAKAVDEARADELAVRRRDAVADAGIGHAVGDGLDRRE